MEKAIYKSRALVGRVCGLQDTRKDFGVRCLVGSDMVSRQIVLTKHSTSVCINEWMRCGGDTVHPLKYLVILGQ